MLAFIARRLAAGVVLLAAISALAFFLLYLGSGSIARKILGEGATPQTIAQETHRLGLDQSLPAQFGHWASGALRGNFGVSWFTGQPVMQAITSRLAVTLSLVICAVLLAAVLSVILGVLAATGRGWTDRVTQLLSLLGYAIPGFLIAVFLVLVFALNLHWFLPTGYVPYTRSLAGWASTVTLPVIALCLGSVAAVTQQIRGGIIDALRDDYVRTLRSRGLSERRIVLKHVLRNTAGPALAILAVQFVGLLGGVVIIEQVFAIPGLGQVAVQAATEGDIPLVMGLVVAVAIIVIIFNLLVDLAQGWLNPKVRLS